MFDEIQVGDRVVPRFGFGAMRLPGPGVWGPPEDRDEAIRVAQRAVELGIRVIDTAWYYGLDVANEILAEALYPYPTDLMFVTKLGGSRLEDGSWNRDHSRVGLRAGMERDLRVLRIDSIPVVHLRYTDNASEPFEACIEYMCEMQQEGFFQHLGLSNVTADQLQSALELTPIATVSNHYGVLDRDGEDVLEICERNGIAFLPFFPLRAGRHEESQQLQNVAQEIGASPAQVAIAWSLRHSPVILPIPGTSKVAHLEENVESASLELSDEHMQQLDQIGMAAVT